MSEEKKFTQDEVDAIIGRETGKEKQKIEAAEKALNDFKETSGKEKEILSAEIKALKEAGEINKTLAEKASVTSLKIAAATKHKLPIAALDHITGSTDEEVEKSASELKSLIGGGAGGGGSFLPKPDPPKEPEKSVAKQLGDLVRGE